jgi:Amt family ammonium transporter
MKKKLIGTLIIMVGLFFVLNTMALAEEPVTQQVLDEVTGSLQVGIDTIWVLFAAFLVFFMNLGFGMVESGLCRAKNTVNILAKNFIVFAISSVAFWVIGWGLMFGDGNPFVGLQGIFFVGGADNSPAIGDAYRGVYSAINWTGVPLWAKFFFQLVFAGTAATIVSGVVAERIKFILHYFFLYPGGNPVSNYRSLDLGRRISCILGHV